VPHINNRWHYHPEVELIHFKKGDGTQFIGDNIKRFKAGDVVLVGAYLPHYWPFDDTYFEENSKQHADVRVAHFCETFWGKEFLELPENVSIKVILEKAKRGLQINGKSRQIIASQLEKLLESDGSERIVHLIEALETIGNCKQVTALSSIGFKHDSSEGESERINAIYEYSLKNFKRKIQLEEIASIANISPNSFFASSNQERENVFLTSFSR
jgi:hypothetical protein